MTVPPPAAPSPPVPPRKPSLGNGAPTHGLLGRRRIRHPWELPLPYVVRTTASLAEVEAALGQAKALDGNGYLLATPTTRRAIEQSGLALLAVRPVFQ